MSGLAFPPTPAILRHMTRPLRIEFSDAIYHSTSRSDRREPIFEGDIDNAAVLSVMEEGISALMRRCWPTSG